MKKIILTLMAAVMIMACNMPEITSSGSINLSVNNSMSRTIGPDISMDAYSFQIRGTGPAGASFVLDTLNQDVLIENLTPGDWSLDIDALNNGGLVIGFGSGSVTVFGGDTSAASIPVYPLEGTGNLSLSMIWETTDVANPQISATLLPSSGGSIPLTFSESSPGTAAAASTLEAGYYTLLLQLLDTDTVVMGTAETVRIAADQTTTGAFDFSDVNSLDGSIDLGIDVDMKTPIDIVLAGTLITMTAGSTFNATASSPAETETITYDWYLNGSPLGSGSIMTVGTGLNPGIYRLDVIALNSDFSRSGSINHTFTVTEP